MIKLTRLDGSEFTVNANLIEVIEANPDTVVSLLTNKKFMVKETPEEITAKVISYYKMIGGQSPVIYISQHSRIQEQNAV